MRRIWEIACGIPHGYCDPVRNSAQRIVPKRNIRLYASPRELVVGFALALTFGFTLQAFMVQRAISDESQRADRAAGTLATGLRSEVEKFGLVTVALSTDREFRDLLESPNPLRRDALNRRLSSLRDEMGASVIYLMDAKGEALVASNWQQPDSFVSQNYQFRSYFRDALKLGEQRQYALGTRSRIPGLYLARRVGDGQSRMGVIVVKIRFDEIERDWRSYPGSVFATDRDGVVLITDDPAQRFRTIAPLTPERRATLRRQLDFGAAPLDPDPRLTGREAATLINRAVPAGPGLTLHVVQSAEASRRTAQVTAWLFTLALMATIGALLLFARWRRQVIELGAQRDAAQRIELLKDELAQANRLAVLGQIAAGVAHEIGQPVTAIAIQADTGSLLSAAGDLAATAQAFARIAALTTRISTITNELRSFARRGMRDAVPARVDAAIDGALLLLSNRIVAAEVQIVRTGQGGNTLVAADAQRCEQVFVNLLQNALDATAGQPGATITISVSREGAAIHIDVVDNGPGIDAEARTMLFQPFKTGKATGLGLGLVISKDIARDMGGDLSFESDQVSGASQKRGQGRDGACFRLTLPAAT